MYSAINRLSVDCYPSFRQGIRWSMNQEQHVKVIGDVAARPRHGWIDTSEGQVHGRGQGRAGGAEDDE